jgi:hypothetical protein
MDEFEGRGGERVPVEMCRYQCTDRSRAPTKERCERLVAGGMEASSRGSEDR